MSVTRTIFKLPYVRGLLNREIIAQSGNEVMSGPFEGMIHQPGIVFSVWYPRILGTYEKEIFIFFNEIIRMNPRVIMDVGAAEGYLAFGFMNRLPDVKVVAFELLEQGRNFLTDTALTLGLSERILIKGEATFETLSKEIGDLKDGEEAVMIMDIEGFEKVLLDPVAIPGLKNIHILVELHEFEEEGITQLIKERFQESHVIEEVITQDRGPSDLPEKLTGFARMAWAELLDEHRPTEMSWLWMKPIGVRLRD